MKKTVQSFWEVHQQLNVLDTVEKDFTKGFAFLNLAKIGFQLPFQSVESRTKQENARYSVLRLC